VRARRVAATAEVAKADEPNVVMLVSYWSVVGGNGGPTVGAADGGAALDW
jgi:hypothetical protein